MWKTFAEEIPEQGRMLKITNDYEEFYGEINSDGDLELYSGSELYDLTGGVIWGDELPYETFMKWRYE